MKLIELLDMVNFSYKFNKDETLSLVDNTSINLNHIENDRFDLDEHIAMKVLDRLENYVYDYIVEDIIEEFDIQLFNDWEDLLNKAKEKKPERIEDLKVLEAVVNPDSIDITDVVNDFIREVSERYFLAYYGANGRQELYSSEDGGLMTFKTRQGAEAFIKLAFQDEDQGKVKVLRLIEENR